MAAALEPSVCGAAAALATADDVGSAAEDAGETAGLPAGVEPSAALGDELPGSVGAVPASLAAVVEVDGSEPVALVVSVGPAVGAEPLVSVPELGLEAGAAAGPDEVGAGDVAVPVGPGAGGVGAAVPPPLGSVDAGGAGAADPPPLGSVDAGGAGAAGSVAIGGVTVPAPPLPPDAPETGGDVTPSVPGELVLTGVDVEVPPEAVGVVAAGDDGAPTGVDDTVFVDVPGGGSGLPIGAAARAAERAGIEANSVSRVVAGAAVR